MRFSLALIRRALLLGTAVLFLTGGSAAAASVWQPPLRPMTVTRGFERPPTPYTAGHRGVDLAGAPGEAVLAAGAGVISYAGPLAGRGVVVVVHGALRTTYEPVQAIVRRGVRVTKGQEIGRLQAGHPGCTVDACLHWGLLRGDAYLDPLSLLGEQRIRLLPPAVGTSAPHAVSVTTFAAERAAPASTMVGVPAQAANPGVTWSVAALAGAGVLVLRRRR